MDGRIHAMVAIILIPVLPLILRRGRGRPQQELHEKIGRAMADILEDSVVEGPKGPYVPQRSG